MWRMDRWYLHEREAVLKSHELSKKKNEISKDTVSRQAEWDRTVPSSIRPLAANQRGLELNASEK